MQKMGNFWNFFTKTDEKIKKNKYLAKIIIFIIVFCIVVGLSFVVLVRFEYLTSNHKWSIIYQNNKAFKDSSFRISIVYNQIRTSYQIWKNFSAINTNWLSWLRVGVFLLALITIPAGFIFIKNNWVFLFYNVFVLALLFNWTDAVIDGKVMDYISINKNWKWLEIILIWPTGIPWIGSGHIESFVFNLPDIFLGIGADGLIVLFVVFIIKKFQQLFNQIVVTYKLKRQMNINKNQLIYI